MITELIIIILIFFIHLIVVKNKEKIFKSYFLDIPNKKRKIHKKPTYLIGGIFIFITYSFFIIFSNTVKDGAIFYLIFSSIFLIGVIDDLRDIQPFKKLIYVFLAYSILIYFDKNFLLREIYFETLDKTVSLGIYSYLISALCILLFVNAINLIDGINGLAMMIFIIYCLFLNYYLGLNLNYFILFIYFLIFFEIYRGNYFLGNSGSLLIGILIGFGTIKAYNLNLIEKKSVEDIFILFLVPGIDMLRLFVQRIINKENPFKADNLHLHHLLIKKFSLNKTLFIYFSIIVCSSYMAFNDVLSEFTIIISILLIYFFCFFYLKRKFDT